MAHRIQVVGLGPGSPALLTQGAVEALRAAPVVVLRTQVHPTVPALAAVGIKWRSFDHLYEEEPTFAGLYARMVDELLRLAENTPVTFAVPGHPQVAEDSVRLLLERAPAAGVSVEVVTGVSFLDVLFTTLSLDPVQGVEVLDALTLAERPPTGRLPLLLVQLYSRQVASDAKLALMAVYPDEHPVTVLRAAGVPGEERRATVPLFELDRLAWVDHLTSAYLAPLPDRTACRVPLDPLVDVMAQLRSPQGCPWDLEQTHASLRPYLIEEAYEVIEAIDAGDMEHLKEELGDLLLQVVFHAQLAGEGDEFTISDVIAGITEKLIRRHPHVFAGAVVSNSADVVRNWDAIKRQEQGYQGPKSLLAKVGKGLSALPRAVALQRQAAKVGFDWPDVGGALDKLCEEAAELREAWQQGDAKHVEEELGDLLFGATNVARKLKADPELALAGTNTKFMRRFRYIEEQAHFQGRQLETMSLEEMDALWEAAKRLETTKN